MQSVAQLAYWEVLALLVGFLALVCIQLVTGQINTQGLFFGRKGDGKQYFSAERVQLLLMTLGAASQFLSDVLRDPVKFPVVPESWILVLGGSHLLYLGGKLGASFLGKS